MVQFQLFNRLLFFDCLRFLSFGQESESLGLRCDWSMEVIDIPWSVRPVISWPLVGRPWCDPEVQWSPGLHRRNGNAPRLPGTIRTDSHCDKATCSRWRATRWRRSSVRGASNRKQRLMTPLNATKASGGCRPRHQRRRRRQEAIWLFGTPIGSDRDATGSWREQAPLHRARRGCSRRRRCPNTLWSFGGRRHAPSPLPLQ